MKYLVIIMVIGCGPKPPVVTWASASMGVNEHVEVRSDGEVIYTTSTNGVQDKNERLSLSTDQVEELADMFRAQKACELVHDPSYTPAPDEGQTTLDLAFPDLRCKVTLWNQEWQRGRARDIEETMHSMRLRPQRPGRIEP